MNEQNGSAFFTSTPPETHDGYGISVPNCSVVSLQRNVFEGHEPTSQAPPE